MKLNLFIFLLSVFSFFSCSDKKEDPKPSNITISVKELVFDAEASSEEISVNATREWGCDVSENWIKVTPEFSTDAQTTVTINVSKNKKASKREGVVTFKSGATRVALTVKQNEGDGSSDSDNIVCPISGYELVWNDEFEQSSKDLDKSVWRHEVQGSGWVNHELQNYVDTYTPDGERVTEVSDGELHITCIKGTDGKIYSGRVYAKEQTGWKYGYMEARIKLPKGKGTWPAFWMMPVTVDWDNEGWPKCGEIDIMEEVGVNPNYVSSSLHAEGHYHANNTQVTKEILCEGAEEDFHVYGMEWTGDYFQFYVDGNKTLYYENDGSGVKNWPYSKPFYIILNLAWGGDWGGWNGVNNKALPTTMDIDYVRVFQKK